MTTLTLRGLAVLGLLSLLPRASALTVTQTIVFGGSGGDRQGEVMGVTNIADYLKWNPSLGGLSSVSIDVITTETAVLSRFNRYSAPLNYPFSFTATHNLYFDNVGFLSSPGIGSWILEYSGGFNTDPINVQSGQWVNYEQTFVSQLHYTVAGPAINRFIGEGPGAFRAVTNAVSSYSDVGNASFQGSTIVTITYRTPDGGNTVALLLAALTIMECFYHRRRIAFLKL